MTFFIAFCPLSSGSAKRDLFAKIIVLNSLNALWVYPWIALSISEITKSTRPILLKCDPNHIKLFGTGENFPKDSEKIFLLNIGQKCNGYGQKTIRGWL